MVEPRYNLVSLAGESMLLTTLFYCLLCWSIRANWFISCWFSEEGAQKLSSPGSLGVSLHPGEGGSWWAGHFEGYLCLALDWDWHAQSRVIWDLRPRSDTSRLAVPHGGRWAQCQAGAEEFLEGWLICLGTSPSTSILKEQGLPSFFIKGGGKKDKAPTRANMGKSLSAQVHSIRTSCSMKWQMRGGVGMECHKPDEKPQGGRKQCFLPLLPSPTPPPLQHWNVPLLELRGWTRWWVMPITPWATFYGAQLPSDPFRWQVERRGSQGGAWGKSACLQSRGLPFLFLFSENKNSFSRKGVLRTKPAESILPVPDPLNAYEPSKMVVCCCYCYLSLS